MAHQSAMAVQTERRAELAQAMLRCSQPSTKVNGLYQNCARCIEVVAYKRMSRRFGSLKLGKVYIGVSNTVADMRVSMLRDSST